ncbi:MAG TPA: hypothetical protein VGX24_01165 [Pyrinomonadaceae bacterium]|jgi:hypothetical protein|nr:hypothetical protein [Pyrinomonadaceae bacterium]
MIRQSFKVKSAAAFLGLLLLLATCVFAAQEGLTKRVRFARGRTTATLKNSVVRGTRDRYLVGARAGQEMTVSINSVERNAVFAIYAPSHDTLEGAGEMHEATSWSGKLPESGDYVVEVGGTRGNATYTLKVSIR